MYFEYFLHMSSKKKIEMKKIKTNCVGRIKYSLISYRRHIFAYKGVDFLLAILKSLYVKPISLPLNFLREVADTMLPWHLFITRHIHNRLFNKSSRAKVKSNFTSITSLILSPVIGFGIKNVLPSLSLIT